MEDDCYKKDTSLFYYQYFCRQDDSDITAKRQEALAIICIGIFICLVFLCGIYYLFETSKLDYKLWDVDTVTAADFTVESTISETMWNNFLQRYNNLD